LLTEVEPTSRDENGLIAKMNLQKNSKMASLYIRLCFLHVSRTHNAMRVGGLLQKVPSEHPAPVETMPSSWVATKCPLCGELRQYIPTEIFQGRVSYQAIKKPVRTVTRGNGARS